MIPIRDRNPSGTFPYITIGIIVINIFIFLYELSLGPVEKQLQMLANCQVNSAIQLRDMLAKKANRVKGNTQNDANKHI